jgi:hypothetical protein
MQGQGGLPQASRAMQPKSEGPEKSKAKDSQPKVEKPEKPECRRRQQERQQAPNHHPTPGASTGGKTPPRTLRQPLKQRPRPALTTHGHRSSSPPAGTHRPTEQPAPHPRGTAASKRPPPSAGQQTTGAGYSSTTPPPPHPSAPPPSHPAGSATASRPLPRRRELPADTAEC